MWKNLLPQETRIIELYSGWALVTIAIFIILQALPIPAELLVLDSVLPWGVLLAIFGGLQVYSIYYDPKLEILRTCMTWVVGCIWLWLAVAGPLNHIHTEDIAALFLGFGNLYSFIINFNTVHIKWKE